MSLNIETNTYTNEIYVRVGTDKDCVYIGPKNFTSNSCNIMGKYKIGIEEFVFDIKGLFCMDVDKKFYLHGKCQNCNRNGIDLIRNLHIGKKEIKISVLNGISKFDDIFLFDELLLINEACKILENLQKQIDKNNYLNVNKM